MTGTRPAFSDAELRAYLAGTAPAETARAIELALEEDEALGARLAALDDLGAALAPAFADLLARAPVAELNARLAAAAPEVPAPAARPGRRGVLAAVAASVALAFGLGVFAGGRLTGTAPGPQRPPWLEAAAGYVRLFTAQTFAAAPHAPEQRAAALAALSRAAALDLAPLAALPELRFQRAELLQLNGRPLGLLAYLDATGAPLAVCILVRPALPAGAPPPAAPVFVQDTAGGLNLVHWDVQPYGFLVIGPQDPAVLRATAEDVAAALAL